jgi:hypothetical protein
LTFKEIKRDNCKILHKPGKYQEYGIENNQQREAKETT